MHPTLMETKYQPNVNHPNGEWWKIMAFLPQFLSRKERGKRKKKRKKEKKRGAFVNGGTARKTAYLSDFVGIIEILLNCSGPFGNYFNFSFWKLCPILPISLH